MFMKSNIFFVLFFTVFVNLTVVAKNHSLKNIICMTENQTDYFLEKLSVKELCEDFESFCYLIETSYSGFSEMKKNGFEIEKMKIDFYNYVKDKEEIFSFNLCNYLNSYLKDYINDNHFAIFFKNSIRNFIDIKKVYFSNTYVKAINNTYKVVFSDEDYLKVNDYIMVSPENLFLTFKSGEEVYRVGILSQNSSEHKVAVKNKDGDFNLECKEKFYSQAKTKPIQYKERLTDESHYMYLSTFACYSDSERIIKMFNNIFSRFVSSPMRTDDRKNIIIDLRGNQGGNPEIALCYLTNLYYKNADKKGEPRQEEYDRLESFVGTYNYEESINSPVVRKFLIGKHKNNKIEIINNKKNALELEVPKFNQNIYFIFNKETSSAAEFFYVQAKTLLGDNCNIKVIGENSAGCINFVNPCIYKLKKSGIVVKIPSTRLIMEKENIVEGIGVIPDYWCSDEGLLETLVNVTGDKKLYEVLKDINWDL